MLLRMLRNVVFVACAAFMLGFLGTSCCGQVVFHAGPNTVEPAFLEEARESVFQVKVSFTVDTTSMDPELKEMAKELGIKIPDTIQKGGRGTAWTVEDDPMGSYLVTAGHLCPDKYTDDELGDLKITKSEFWVVRRDGGESLLAQVVSVDHKVDLCLLRTVGRAGRPLAVTDIKPRYGEHVSFIGAPFARWGGNIAPVFEGLYSGYGRIFNEDDHDFLMLTFSAGPGASGSPVFYGNAVIGVVVEGDPQTWHMMEAVPGDLLLKFLGDAGVFRDDPLLQKTAPLGGIAN